MPAPILFVLLFVVSFGVLFYFLRPTAAETAVEQRLAGIEESRVLNVDGTTTILREQAFSSNPLLHDLIRQLPGSLTVANLIRQAGQKWQVSSVLLFSLLATIIGWWLASLVIPIVALSFCVGLAFGISPSLYLFILRETRFRRFDALLPEAVDLMSRGLRAGHAVSAVLEMVGNEVADPVGVEFRAMAEEQSLGLPLRDAMMGLVERVPRDDVRFLATAILLQKETGGNLAHILDKTAAVMRERARLRGQLMIYTAQGRISGWILCAAPFAMFGLLSVINKKYEMMLFTDPLGQDMLYAGLIMMALGILVIRKIIDIKV
jgi:tight adherence protein B